MTLRTRTFCIVVAIGVVAIYLLPSPPQSPPTIAWKPGDLAGWQYDLVSDNEMVNHRFSADGTVLSVVGTKGGALRGPVFRWEVTPEGALRIYQSHDGETVYLLEQVSIDDRSVLVWDVRSRQQDLYRRTR